jgi:uncharacterized protein (DUF58 family)
VLSVAFAGLLSALSVYVVDRIERMSEGPAPAEVDLLRLVFLSGSFVLGILTYALIAGTSRSLLALALLPVLVAAALAGLWARKSRRLAASARLRRELFEREAAECSRALERDPQNAAAHARLAELYETAGDRARAAEHGRRVCELAPSEKNRRRLAELEGRG